MRGFVPVSDLISEFGDEAVGNGGGGGGGGGATTILSPA